ncbi:hypothetical protein EHS25_008383 [Saitozyma podzolica]|uniref:N-acetyl-D-glucosamine kinase n=1 Tax=Saitozyma podzolica TaxID=1890683 RepID=A0A427YPD7_9TREE|nr:hypothetical protein EHS25_008383 [Saitozyma podzolica]
MVNAIARDMPLFLCIDGGGTKTVAVISDAQGAVLSRGEAGPSNLTAGVKHTVAAVISSTQEAISRLPGPSITSWPCSDPVFSRVWVGIAGCARPPDHALLSPFIADLFPGSTWRLTNDGELLTAPITSTDYRVMVTVICGTGSLALRWSRPDLQNPVRQVARSGGWGALLGDEGSGWSMGKEGVKSLLTFAANDRPLVPFHHEVMERLGINDPHDLYPALALSLSGDVDATQAEAERKKKIAGCTKHIVTAALGGDGEAMRILKKVASEVVDLLRPLVEDPVWGAQGEEGTLLVLGGGLSSVKEFRQLVVQGMDKEGWKWGDVKVVSDPAVDGVKALASL